MKPANFPGRKNDRRKRALSRMRARDEFGYNDPYFRTEVKILSDADARSIRTKKDRSARGKLR
jgi:hypothetical protein